MLVPLSGARTLGGSPFRQAVTLRMGSASTPDELVPIFPFTHMLELPA
jgi:hypothetical protein